MPELVDDCPRCGSKRITFDVMKDHKVGGLFELFSVCRHCERATIFYAFPRDDRAHVIIQTAGSLQKFAGLNQILKIGGFVSQKDGAAVPPPEHLPNDIQAAFTEGAKCLASECFNAAATMFRLCIDLATRKMLPEADENGLTPHIRRSLGLRMHWIFNNDRLPATLRELSSCVKEDGNDGAHEGTLSKEDAEDLLDFTIALLERLYTEPERLRLAKDRRTERRSGVTKS